MTSTIDSRSSEGEGLLEERYADLKEAFVVGSRRVFDALNHSDDEMQALVDVLDVLKDIVEEVERRRPGELARRCKR